MKRFFAPAMVIALVLIWAGEAACQINVNTASQKELESLPGIGPVMAGRIIEGRPYRNVNDLRRVKGIGPATLDKFKHLVTAGPAAAPPPPPAREAPVARKAAPAPVSVPVYSVERYNTLKCFKCSNVYQVSSDLKDGWCPYCGLKWHIRGAAEAAPPAAAPPAAAAPPPAAAAPVAGAIPFTDAGNYTGQTKTVEGTIVGTHLSSRSRNLYLNFHKDYTAYISVKIPAADLGKFRSDAASYYNGKKVIATGMINKEGNFLRLTVTDPARLRVVD